MPNIKSAGKRMKTSARKRLANRSVISQIAVGRIKLDKAVADGDSGAATSLLRQYGSLLDKAVKKGVVKANTASRKKSRAAKRLNAMATAKT